MSKWVKNSVGSNVLDVTSPTVPSCPAWIELCELFFPIPLGGEKILEFVNPNFVKAAVLLTAKAPVVLNFKNSRRFNS